MVRINLLPVREIKRRALARQQIISFVLGLFCLLILLGLVFFFQTSKATQLQQDISRLKSEKQRYTTILGEMKQLKKDKKVVETQISVIKQLQRSSSLTVHILDEVANITPSRRMWLTSLTQSGNNLKMDGMALDNRTIAGYMEQIKKSPYIQNVDLANSSLKTFAGRNLKSFSLSCSIAVPEETKEPEKK
ncbi:MAG: pilus assembly protein PilN [Desulfobulbaceae bacterium]|nr:pilus assembly protein PilN [Desulfobulbaceae bacterium]